MYQQGIVVYETYLPKNKYLLSMTIHDIGLIFLDDEPVDQHSRIRTDYFETLIECKLQKCRLLILVEAMGHNNYGQDQE
jgi:hypothetical protein